MIFPRACYILIVLLGPLTLIGLSTGCSVDSGSILPSPNTTDQSYIMIISQTATHKGYTLYDVDGNLVDHLGDFRTVGGTPRGMTYWDSSSVLVSMESPDGIFQLGLDGTLEQFGGSNFLSGNIYDLVQSLDGSYVYIIESNRIERLTAAGLHQTNNYMDGSVGACTINTPRGLGVSPEGYILVTNQGGSDDVLRIDDTGASPSCVSSVAFGNNPYPIMMHSDGNLYVGTQGDDSIYVADPDGNNASILWAPGTGILNNPMDMLELPNGDILVSSSVTDTIERVTTAGVRVGSVPFIRSSLSENIIGMVLIQGAQR